MTEKRRTIRWTLAVLFAFSLLGALPAYAHGDKIVTHLLDGVNAAGTGYRTKLDIVNLGPTGFNLDPLKNTTIEFYKEDGSPWNLATNRGNTDNVVPLSDLEASQTIRVETQGASPTLTAGYAIIRSLEPTTSYPEDYNIGVTAYYEVSKNGKVVDTVSIPLGQPTVSWIFPVENKGASLLTGLALLNLAGQNSTVTLDLIDSNGAQVAEQKVYLGAHPYDQENVKKAVFVNILFPGTDDFKGSIYGYATGPVAVLALLQTETFLGGDTVLQYATLVPSYLDGLRSNTYTYLREGFPLDADALIVDYTYTDDSSWDLLYQNTPPRQLVPQPGAALCVIGNDVTDDDFDNSLTLEDLRGRTYSTDPIDLSAPKIDFTFAIRTGLGRYAKVRIADIIDVGGQFIDLALEVYVYK